MATSFVDDSGVTRFEGEIVTPGATPGDVLTVGAGGVIAPAPGGGSQPGAGVWIGPYSVDFGDLPDNLDTVDLFTLDTGEFCVGYYVDPTTAVVWDEGTSLSVSNFDGPFTDAQDNQWCFVDPTSITDLTKLNSGNQTGVDLGGTGLSGFAWPATGNPTYVGYLNFTSPAAAGHIDLYFCIATPVAP